MIATTTASGANSEIARLKAVRNSIRRGMRRLCRAWTRNDGKPRDQWTPSLDLKEAVLIAALVLCTILCVVLVAIQSFSILDR